MLWNKNTKVLEKFLYIAENVNTKLLVKCPWHLSQLCFSVRIIDEVNLSGKNVRKFSPLYRGKIETFVFKGLGEIEKWGLKGDRFLLVGCNPIFFHEMRMILQTRYNISLLSNNINFVKKCCHATSLESWVHITSSQDLGIKKFPTWIRINPENHKWQKLCYFELLALLLYPWRPKEGHQQEL